ncbi:hypothetical protein ACF0H5_020183 [Mactra antiquata]
MAQRKNRNIENGNSQSLMNVLNKFVEECNAMDDKVMVPSRLRDMELSDLTCNTTSEENNNMSVLPMSSATGEDLYSYYVMINAVKGELLSGKGPSQAQLPSTEVGLQTSRVGMRVIGESDGESDTLSDDCSMDDGASDSDTATKTAEAFRHHLQGLFGLLNQLTDTAKFLGDTYEQQVGGRKTKKFAI